MKFVVKKTPNKAGVNQFSVEQVSKSGEVVRVWKHFKNNGTLARQFCEQQAKHFGLRKNRIAKKCAAKAEKLAGKVGAKSGAKLGKKSGKVTAENSTDSDNPASCKTAV